MSNQVPHPCLIPDPENPRRVFLYFTGCPPLYTGGVKDIPGPNPRGENTIRRMYADAAADLSRPESWTLDPRPISSESTGSDWDDDRLGYLNAVLYNDADKTWYAYYWAGKTPSTRRIGVATSADGLHWRRCAGNPIINPGDGEFDIEAGDVIKEGDQWFMLFCVGNSPSRNGQSYKSAVSKDGLHWTRAGTVLDIGKPGTSDAGAFEFGSLLKLRDGYAFIYEAMNRYGGPGYRWTINLAFSDSLTAGHWTRSARNPVFTGSGVPGSLDENHVGTPSVYTVNGQRYLFYQAIVTDGKNMDLAVATFAGKGARPAAQPHGGLAIPTAIAGDPLLAEAYRAAAEQNVLRALNPTVFFGYFSVCADGQGHGHNTTYPGLDWGQSAEALLWLGRRAEVLASWEYVKGFQRDDGLLPFAILPDRAGTTSMVSGRYPLVVDERGAVFEHWVPGNPLRTLANVTFLLLAGAIWTQTRDRVWLKAQAPSLRRAADWLRTQITPDGLMRGGGFYVERPTRLEFDGINQCYSAHALAQAAALLDHVDETAAAGQCRTAADALTAAFRARFWAGDHCVEYIHPEHGPISRHGLTDVDWAAVATETASDEQIAALWPQLKDNRDFIYSGIPGGIATRPETYEDWEMQQIDRHDLAAMGRVWYLECWARARMGDRDGLLRSLRKVAAVGQANNWSWMERYCSEKTGDLRQYHFQYYCEYPAIFIRVVNRFVGNGASI